VSTCTPQLHTYNEPKCHLYTYCWFSIVNLKWLCWKALWRANNIKPKRESTAVAAFFISSRQDVSCHVHITPLMTGFSLLTVGRCETIHRISRDRMSAAENSDDNWKHFRLRLTDHDALWLFDYCALKYFYLLTYLLMVDWCHQGKSIYS